MKTELSAIFRRNVLTPFVLIVCLLVGLLLFLGRDGDALFLASTITLNSLVGIVQEVRAQSALRRLELLNPVSVRRRTSRGYELITLEEVRIGDHLELSSGDQVPADGPLLESHGLEVNEALLSGESREVAKGCDDQVLAGSSVVAGRGVMQVSACGSGTRVGQMRATLRTYEPRLSPLQRTLTRIIRWLTYLALAVAALIVLDGRQHHDSFSSIVTTVVSGAITLVPEGLVLAATLLFSYGALKLARQSVLAQHISAMEGFGRLAILCLDKTGTLTEARLELEELHPFFPYPEHRMREFLGGFLAAEPEPTASLAALAGYCLMPAGMDIADSLPFSSFRKFSAISLIQGEKRRSLALGAPEVLARHAPLTAAMEEKRHAFATAGYRVLLLVDLGESTGSLETLAKGGGQPVGLVILRSRLRGHIADTLFYLQAQGVSLRIISGDAPETVVQVAQAAGVLGTERVLTGSQLAEMDAATWRHEVPKATVFARVLPEQKQRLVRTFQRIGFTGMVGDGVNDALALKQADLSIAMLEGSAASRQVADVVLLKSDFTAIPDAIRLGAQIILALEMVACLFFNKVSYGLAILLWSLAANTAYPFSPRHLVLLNLLCIGIPTFVWSLLPPEASYKMDPRHFFRRTLRFAIPNGIVTGLAVIVGTGLNALQGHPYSESSAVLTVLLLGLLSFRLIPRSLEAVDTVLQRRIQALYMAGCLLLTFGAAQWRGFVSLFQLNHLDLSQILTVGVVCLLAGWLQAVLAHHHKPLV